MIRYELPGAIAPSVSQAHLLNPERSEGSPTNRGILRLRSGLVIEWKFTAAVMSAEVQREPEPLHFLPRS
jgi:hypothetical protein